MLAAAYLIILAWAPADNHTLYLCISLYLKKKKKAHRGGGRREGASSQANKWCSVSRMQSVAGRYDRDGTYGGRHSRR